MYHTTIIYIGINYKTSNLPQHSCFVYLDKTIEEISNRQLQ